MKSPITKEHIFKCLLSNEPIVVDMTTDLDQLRFREIRKLFYETGVYKQVIPYDSKYRLDTMVMHEVHLKWSHRTVTFPRNTRVIGLDRDQLGIR